MSWQYGWNAQSALMPEKNIEIKVGNKGLQKMKAAMNQLKQQNKNKSHYKNTTTSIIKPEVKRNKGIQQRIQQDEQKHSLQNNTDNRYLQLVQKQLQKKQKIYNNIQTKPKNHSLFLVDFVQKQLSKEDEQIQALKKDFYAGKLKQIIQQQNKIHNNCEEYNSGVHQSLRQNLAWQKQVLQQLNGQFSSYNESKVAQSFDKKLSQQQRKALQRVILERMREKKRVEQLKKQREEGDIQKIRKLRKLDILSDDD